MIDSTVLATTVHKIIQPAQSYGIKQAPMFKGKGR